jgi:hypothetical protein
VYTLAKVAALLAGAYALKAQSPTGPAVPNVSFEYGPLVDRPCYATAKLPLDTTLIRATARRVPIWRDAWARKAPELFRTAAAITHSTYSFAETKAAIITCPTYVSMSLPLMINVAKLFRDDTVPVANDTTQFVSLLFHENLHRHISDLIRARPDSTTPLLTKYAAEAPVVLAHLHLLALMDTVYRQVGRVSNLLRPSGRSAPLAGGYRGENDMDRAREIVRTEGVAAFIRELQPNRASSPRH